MNKVLAWISFLVAIIAGAGLAATAPGLVQIVVVFAALGRGIVDVAKDRIPNREAVIVAVALPSLIVGMNGKVVDAIDRWLGDLWGWADGTVGAWAGTGSTMTAAAAAVAVSFLLAQRSMSGGSSTGDGASSRLRGRVR